MGLPRFIQLVGLILVSYVMIRSYQVSDMTFQFGGLALGMLVFAAGKLLERRANG